MKRRSFLKGMLAFALLPTIIPEKKSVIVDPVIEYENCKLGYSGKATFDSGYFYCPYIPLMTTKVVV